MFPLGALACTNSAAVSRVSAGPAPACAQAAREGQAHTPVADSGLVTLTGAIRAVRSSPDQALDNANRSVNANGNANGTGQIITGWLTPDEAREWSQGSVRGATFRALFERFRIEGSVDGLLNHDVHYRIQAPAEACPLVVLDRDHSFWNTLFNRGGRGMVGLAPCGGGPVELKAAASSSFRSAIAKAREPCGGPRMELVTLDAPEVAGAVGNPTQRRFCVYLPPSYSTAPTRRYPIVFVYGGFMSNEMARFQSHPHAGDWADAIAETTGHEAILVGVDASTRTGSSYLEDSPITGQWETFMVRAVRAFDTRFRTLGTRDARAMIGQSTGGYLAVSFGMKHSELIGAIGATAPDALDLRSWFFESSGSVKPWIASWMRLDASVGGAGQMTSYAADWSPKDSGHYEWPLDLATAKPNATFGRWLSHSPSTMLEQPEFARTIRERLSDRILLAISEHDEFDLTEPAIAFSQKLRSLGIAHDLDISPEGHMTGTPARTEKALRFVISRMPITAP